MFLRTSSFPLGGLTLASMLAAALSACSMFGGSEPNAAATASTGMISQASAGAGELDPRQFLGPDYCPEIRIREGTEVKRNYERGHEDDPAFVIWQGSVAETARECLYDPAGNLTLRIGVSGRVIAGPRGGPQTVQLPLRIVVVKHKEAVLASELYPLTVAIPPGNSTVFREVREITVPSPGTSRDYIIYIGFDEKGENLLDPGAARVAAKPAARRRVDDEIVDLEEPAAAPRRRAAPAAQPAAPAPRQAQPAPQQAKPAEPNVLPTPSGGFVLSR